MPAEINGSQIVDGTITDSDIAANADIAITKIFQGDRIVKRSGAGNINETADKSMNNCQINDLAANTDTKGAINYGQLAVAVATLNATIASIQTGLKADAFVVNEVLSGVVNGINKIFTLANTPVVGSVQVFHGLPLIEGVTEDYTISGVTVTFNTAPISTAKPPRANYIKA